MSKVWGKQNPADLLTKFLDSESIVKCLELFGFEYMTGRSTEAPNLSSITIDASAISSIRNPNLHNPKPNIKHILESKIEAKGSSTRSSIGSLTRSFFISLLFRIAARPKPLTQRCPRQGNLGQGGVPVYNSVDNVHNALHPARPFGCRIYP